MPRHRFASSKTSFSRASVASSLYVEPPVIPEGLTDSVSGNTLKVQNIEEQLLATEEQLILVTDDLTLKIQTADGKRMNFRISSLPKILHGNRRLLLSVIC